MVLGMSRPWKHPKTGVYWFRKAVPEAMRQLVRRVEVRRSLHTKDPREAVLRFTEVAAKVAAEWEALRRGPEPLTPRQAAALAGLWYRWFTAAREEEPGEDPDGWTMLSEQLHDIDLSGRPELDERDISPQGIDDSTLPRSPATQRRIDAFLMDRGRINAFFEARDLHLFPSQLPDFMTALEVEFHAAMRLLSRRAGRDYRPDRGPRGSRVAAQRTAQGGPSRRPHADTHRHPGRMVDGGEGHGPQALDPRELLEHHGGAGRLPRSRRRQAGHPGGHRALQGPPALQSINPRTGKPISAKTVKDSDLSGLKTLFGWAVSNRKLPSNPVTGITIKLGKPQKLRSKGLTEDEAKAILQAALKVTRGGEVGGHLRGEALGPVAGGLHRRTGWRACPATQAGRSAGRRALDHPPHARGRDHQNQRGPHGGPPPASDRAWLPCLRGGCASRSPVPEAQQVRRRSRAATGAQEPA